MKKTCPITCKQLVKQAVSDWFGKEVQTGYTTTYVWMANQLGHFTLGFLFTFVIVWIVKLINPDISPTWPLLWVPIGEFLFWTYKEVRDYFVALKVIKQNEVFPCDKRDIALDAGTAVLFISFGIVSSYLSLFGYEYSLISIGATLIFGLPVARYWLLRKMCFQQAGLLYQYRLSSFHVTISDENVKGILDFVDLKEDSWSHLLIFGEREKGKTSMASGIGTELSFNKGIARYTTYFKFLELLEESTKKLVYIDGKYLWNWNMADILIIDDVNPISERNELISAQEVKASIEVLSNEKRAELEKRKTVWILGLPDNFEDTFVHNWKKMFSEALRVNENSIGVVELV